MQARPDVYYSLWTKPVVKGKAWKAPERITLFLYTIRGGGFQFALTRSDDMIHSGSCVQR